MYHDITYNTKTDTTRYQQEKIWTGPKHCRRDKQTTKRPEQETTIRWDKKQTHKQQTLTGKFLNLCSAEIGPMSERVLHRPQLLRAKRRPKPLRLLVVSRRHLPRTGRRAARRHDLFLGLLDQGLAGRSVLVVGYLVGVLVVLFPGTRELLGWHGNIGAVFRGQTQYTGDGKRTVEHLEISPKLLIDKIEKYIDILVIGTLRWRYQWLQMTKRRTL